MGFNSSDAPVGVRYFVGEKVAVDVGVGFESQDLGETSASSFWFEFGVPYVLYDYNSSYFFVRPAIAYASLDDYRFQSESGGGSSSGRAFWSDLPAVRQVDQRHSSSPRLFWIFFEQLRVAVL